AALNRIIRVCAGREAQRRQRDHQGRKSGHHRSPLGRQPGRTDNDNGYIAPFLSTNPALRLCEPEALAAVGLENLLAEPVRGDLVETVGKPPSASDNALSGSQNWRRSPPISHIQSRYVVRSRGARDWELPTHHRSADRA